MTKYFQLPSNDGGVLDGDWTFLVAIRKTATVQWQLNIFGHHDEGFPKTYDGPPFCGNQKVLVATRKGNWKKFGRRNVHNQNFFGHYNVSNQKFFGHHKASQPNFFNHPSLWQLKKFQSPQGANWNRTRCGDRKFLVTILPSLFFRWRPNCFNRHKRGIVIFFGKLSSRIVKRFSKKHVACPLF